MEKLSEARIYVGTYAKYNEGSIFGKWMDLSDYSGSEEFYDACRELHSDEEDPEMMFQDWEKSTLTLPLAERFMPSSMPTNWDWI